MRFPLLAILSVFAVGAHRADAAPPGIDPKAPYASEVRAVFDAVRYSKLSAFEREDLRLKLDFEAGEWKLLGWNRKGPSGIALDSGGAGTCAGLSLFALDRLGRVVDKSRYELVLARGREAGYFSAAESGHYFLVLSDRESGGRWILDPSFGRYGAEDALTDYEVIAEGIARERLTFHVPDQVLAADTYAPILVSKEHMVFIGVSARRGRFDPGHYSVSLYVKRRFHFTGRPVYEVVREPGGARRTRDEALGREVLGAELYGRLTRRLDALVESALP